MEEAEVPAPSILFWIAGIFFCIEFCIFRAMSPFASSKAFCFENSPNRFRTSSVTASLSPACFFLLFVPPPMSWVRSVARIFSFLGEKLLVVSLEKEDVLPLSAALVGLVSETIVWPGAAPEKKRREEKHILKRLPFYSLTNSGNSSCIRNATNIKSPLTEIVCHCPE